MLIFLALLYVPFTSIHAAPLDIISNDTGLNDLVLPTCVSAPSQRRIQVILWNCFATIFLFTWSSVHPNVPGPSEGWLKATLRRVELMLWAIFAPEAIFFWAMKQRKGARIIWREIHNNLRGQDRSNWTRIHAHFLQMGGFMLMDGDVNKGVLTLKTFQQLLREEKIDFPKITEKEIQDHNKRDALGKLVVVVQAGLFIIQFLVRLKQGSDYLTRVEWNTFALVSGNLSIFYVWWEKPSEVECSIPVPLRPGACTPMGLIQDANLVSASHNQQDIEMMERRELLDCPNQVTLESGYEVVEQEGAISRTWLFFPRRFNALIGRNQAVAKGATQVPIFYYEDDKKQYAALATLHFAVVLLGLDIISLAIFTPSSLAQQWLYAVSFTLMTTSLFIAVCSCALAAAAQNLAVGIYLLARLTFLMLGFVALGGLSPEALSDTQWPYFILFFIGS